ncbi:hypothetical protein OAX78_02025 [Planctomycetota bacterium]|nr:hypothetical protein [Planctomycetota bacterium]
MMPDNDDTSPNLPQPVADVASAAMARTREKWATAFAGALWADFAMVMFTGGLPVFSAVTAGLQRVFDSNGQVGLNACHEALKAQSQQLEEMAQRQDISEEQIGKRITGMMRVLQESGRHPEKEIQNALGVFAARILVTDLDQVTQFELADTLGRLTSLDLAMLLLASDLDECGKRIWLNAKSEIVEVDANKQRRAGDGWALAARLHERYGLECTGEVGDRVARRLARENLVTLEGPQSEIVVAALGQRLLGLVDAKPLEQWTAASAE